MPTTVEEILGRHQTRGSAGTFSDSALLDYIVCPAKAFINSYSGKKSPRQQARDRFYPMLSEIAVNMLGGNRPIDPDSLISDITLKAFGDLEYWKREIDLKAVHSMFTNFIYMISRDEFTVSSLSKKFSITYNSMTIDSQIDLNVTDRKGRICPTVVDFSNTKYDNIYNPILYKCQMVCDYLKTLGTNTQVLVLTICAGKQWPYDQKRYDGIMTASIKEYLAMMDQDFWPARVGWWCVNCYYRGICHRLLTTDEK
jgi:hypothetical protein